jgi:hypothetical protein
LSIVKHEVIASSEWCKYALTKGLAREETVVSNAHEDQYPSAVEDPWDVFVLDEDAMEPEPEFGDFWGELDDDFNNRGE